MLHPTCTIDFSLTMYTDFKAHGAAWTQGKPWGGTNPPTIIVLLLWYLAEAERELLVGLGLKGSVCRSIYRYVR